jgi:hypothetical protein
MAKLGYNILVGERHLAEDISKSGADYHIVVTAPPNGINQKGDIEALDWWQTQLPNSKIIKREYSGLEGDWSLYRSPKDQVAIWKKENRPNFIQDSQVNEPSLAWRDIELHKRYVKREVEIVKRMKDAGLKYAAGAFGVGLPYEGYIQQGIYDDLIKEAEYLSAHLYGTGMVDYGEVVDYAVLLEPHDIQWQKWAYEAAKHYYLLRRPDEFAHRAEFIGAKMPKVLATECFIDQIPDASYYLNKVDRSLKIAQYNYDLRGFQAWEAYWRHVYPSKSLNQVLAYMAEHFLTNVIWPDFYEAAMLFAVNPLWDTPQGSNYGNNAVSEFRKVLLPAINKKVAGTYTMSYEKGTVTITSGYKNVRTAPVNGTQGIDIGDIQVGSYELERSTDAVFASGNDWREYRNSQYPELPVVFWMADSILTWVVTPSEDQLFTMDFNGSTLTRSRQSFQDLRTLLTDMADSITDVIG